MDGRLSDARRLRGPPRETRTGRWVQDGRLYLLCAELPHLRNRPADSHGAHIVSSASSQRYACVYPPRSRLTREDADRIAQATVYLADSVYVPATAAVEPSS